MIFTAPSSQNFNYSMRGIIFSSRFNRWHPRQANEMKTNALNSSYIISTKHLSVLIRAAMLPPSRYPEPELVCRFTLFDREDSCEMVKGTESENCSRTSGVSSHAQRFKRNANHKLWCSVIFARKS
jgi:hypothetical protein